VRLTIAKKIALAVIGTVILSIGTMTWVVSQNLQRGFVAYLNEMQAQDLAELADMLAVQYRQRGNLELLRHNPEALRELLTPKNLQSQFEDDRPPPYDFHHPPPRSGRRQGPPDPFGFGSRLSMQDESGRPLFGPPNPQHGLTKQIIVDGQIIGTLQLTPFVNISNTNASIFVRGQVRDMLWLAVALILFSGLLASWLARQLLRPVASLRDVTQRIAQGQLEARAPVINNDELGELAQHVNGMAQALEVNEKQRRRMIADVSHELRTPLSVIRGEIEALQDGIRQADSAALSSLHAEVLQLNKLVDDLHQLALADAGDLHYQPQRVDLVALVQSILFRFQSRTEKAGLVLKAILPPENIDINADPNRITQVITNLLENSVRYTHSGGTILVTLSVHYQHVVLSIADSAPGVPEGQHARLFERLYRVDEARSRERGGSGLGLSICKALIAAHCGEIDAMPSSLGGVQVVIKLPIILETVVGQI